MITLVWNIQIEWKGLVGKRQKVFEVGKKFGKKVAFNLKNFQVNHRKRKNELGNLGHSRTSQLVAWGRFYKSYFRNNFFDGLKQYGRDFGKIKTFMSLKAAKDHQIKERIIIADSAVT